MAFSFEFPHSTQFDSDLREILELYKSVKDLPADFHDLKQFVMNFFDNLDVQKEVNNKLDAMAEDGTLDDIINVKIFNDLNNKVNTVINDNADIKKSLNIVNVKAFGAKGDGITNDVEAIDAALDFANANGFRVIYFPDGNYYLPNKTYTIDTSKLRWVGENTTKLTSHGLPNGSSFITLTSPLSLEMYDYARVPLSNICINGNYFSDDTEKTVTAISYGNTPTNAETMVSPHLSLYNLTITNFGIGLYLASGYKSSAFNLNIIACNYGIYITQGGIVPWNCYCAHIECCNTAVYSLSTGYSEARFFGGAFEYNRRIFNGYGKHSFLCVRFEGDLRSACDKNLNAFPMFNMTSPDNGYLSFNGCSFLLIPNYTENVTYWVKNPYITTNLNQSMIFGYSSSYYGKAQIIITNSEIASEQTPSSTYLISAQKIISFNNTYYGKNYSELINQSNIVKPQENGFIV